MKLLLVGAVLVLSGKLEAADHPGAERMAGLIQSLSSPKFADRDQAYRELIGIGEPALKQLVEASRSKDAEVRERALAAIELIERKIENDKLLLAPKLRLRYNKTPLQDAIAELSRQTGLKYQLDPKSGKDPRQPITLDTGEVPYWDAVERFLAAAGLTEVPPAATPGNPNQLYFEMQQPQLRGFRGRSRPQPKRVEPVIQLVEAKTTLSASTSTLVRVKALPKGAVNGGAVKGSNHLLLHLEVTPAPALVWQGVVNVDVRKVVDERGALLAQSHTHQPLDGAPNTIWGDGIQIIQQGQAQIIIQGGQGAVQIWSADGTPNQPPALNPRHVPVALIARDGIGKTLKELQGVITAEVLAPPSTVVALEKLSTVRTKDTVRKDNYEMEVVERTETNDQIRLRVRVRVPMQNNFIAFGGRAQGFVQFDGPAAPGQSQIQLQEADGRPVNGVPLQLLEQSFDGLTQTSLYSLVINRKSTTAPATLAVIARKQATVEIPFALKDVPLP